MFGKTTDVKSTSTRPSDMSYKSVASLEKIRVTHEIVIRDFADWRSNVDFFGQISGSFDVPIPDTKKKKRNLKARLHK